MATLTKKDLLEVIKDMPMDMPIMGMRVCVRSEGQTCERFRSLRDGYIDGAKRAVTIKNHNYSKI